MKKHKGYLSITVVFIVLGILLSFQYKAQNRFSGDLTMERSESLIAMVKNLSEKRQRLNVEYAELNIKLSELAQSSRNESNLANNLKAEIDKLNIVTGATGVKGPGLIITIDQYMPILYIDIIYLVNELWAAGAEAIAINDQRITARSNIFYAEDEHNMYITVNNQKLNYPITIMAIGDPNNLDKGLTLPGGIIDNLSLFRAYPQLEHSKSLTLPPSPTSSMFIFMEEYIPPPENTADGQEAPKI